MDCCEPIVKHVVGGWLHRRKIRKALRHRLLLRPQTPLKKGMRQRYLKRKQRAKLETEEELGSDSAEEKVVIIPDSPQEVIISDTEVADVTPSRPKEPEEPLVDSDSDIEAILNYGLSREDTKGDLQLQQYTVTGYVNLPGHSYYLLS